MTGHYTNRTGAWHTVMGRSFLREDEKTVADIFKESGYKTGIFGKWHLGDNYPYRPRDRGFDEVLIHGGGGVGQTPDYWDNDYFDDTYCHNGQWKPFKGFCTDVWFDGAIRFIEAHGNRPFFCYISTNAPHGPFNVPERYSRPYKERGIPDKRARFYGMITNIDDNMAGLEHALLRLGIRDNTILLFITDNGTAAGVETEKDLTITEGFGAGMRGKKGCVYEGGHRVPCFIRWPQGRLNHGQDVDRLTAHIDIVPTLIDLCGLDSLPDFPFDGKSLEPILKHREDHWPERTLVVDNQRLEYLKKYKEFAVMTDRWRLVGNYGRGLTYRVPEANQPGPIVEDHLNNLELYDILADPGQEQNVADTYPDVIPHLFQAYETWWASVSQESEDFPRIVIGSAMENPSTLTSHDWHFDTGQVPWNHRQIRSGIRSNGFWTLRVAKSGVYEFNMRRWPRESGLPINAGAPVPPSVTGMDMDQPTEGKSSDVRQARVKIGDVDISQPGQEDDEEVSFEIRLEKGNARLQTWFVDQQGQSVGAYYVYVRKHER